MSKRDDLTRCSNYREFRSYAEKHNGEIREGKEHTIVSTPKGSAALPRHGSHDYGTGLKHKLIKAFLAIGITVLFIAFVLSGIGMV